MALSSKWQMDILQELEALRELRMAVGKMICHINQGDEHPKDLQQVKMFLSKAEEVEVMRLKGDHTSDGYRLRPRGRHQSIGRSGRKLATMLAKAKAKGVSKGEIGHA